MNLIYSSDMGSCEFSPQNDEMLITTRGGSHKIYYTRYTESLRGEVPTEYIIQAIRNHSQTLTLYNCKQLVHGTAC